MISYSICFKNKHMVSILNQLVYRINLGSLHIVKQYSTMNCRVRRQKLEKFNYPPPRGEIILYYIPPELPLLFIPLDYADITCTLYSHFGRSKLTYLNNTICDTTQKKHINEIVHIQLHDRDLSLVIFI